MKLTFRRFLRSQSLAVLCLGLLLPVRLVAAEYVEVTAELQIDSWSFWFGQDKETSSEQLRETANTVFTRSWPIRCVVGSNTWMMENDYTEQTGQKVTRWFTGTNMFESTLITRAKSEEYYRRFSQATKVAMTAPRVGSNIHAFTKRPTVIRAALLVPLI